MSKFRASIAALLVTASIGAVSIASGPAAEAGTPTGRTVCCTG